MADEKKKKVWIKRNGRKISSDLSAEFEGYEKNGRKWKKEQEERDIRRNPSLDCRGRWVRSRGAELENNNYY